MVALSVDSAERNEAMRARWNLPFQFESDPDGKRFLKPLDIWNPRERDGIAQPTLLIISREGEVLFKESSRDFADRIHDEDAFEALEELGLDAVSPKHSEPSQADTDQKGAFKPEYFVPYFKGNFFAAKAVGLRLSDEGRKEADLHQEMSDSFLDAWKEWSGKNKR